MCLPRGYSGSRPPLAQRKERRTDPERCGPSCVFSEELRRGGRDEGKGGGEGLASENERSVTGDLHSKVVPLTSEEVSSGFRLPGVSHPRLDRRVKGPVNRSGGEGRSLKRGSLSAESNSVPRLYSPGTAPRTVFGCPGKNPLFAVTNLPSSGLDRKSQD